MNLDLIKRESAPVMPYDLASVKETYEAIAEAQDEVGGTVTFRAKMPSAGGKSFTIDTGNEDMEVTTPKLEGVIIHSHKCNARFAPNTRGEPPICSSMDAKVGIDTDGVLHTCDDCPFNKFGSSEKGTGGKACKNMIRLYMMTDASPIPILVTLPPTSLKSWQNYRIGVLAGARLKPIDVVTELTLTSEVSKSGDKYAKIKPKMVGRLDEDTRKIAEFFASGFTVAPEITVDDYYAQQDAKESEGTDA